MNRDLDGADFVANAVTILGSDDPCGTYILRMEVSDDIAVRFGRYRQGSPVAVGQGDVVYVGSAMARIGSMTLARRLLRHATRRPPKAPHHLRSMLVDVLASSGLASNELQPPGSKKLFWNIDYLLDEDAVHLQQIYVLRSSLRMEDEVAKLLAADASCQPVAPGLGAHDRPGSTHLLYVHADDGWWHDLAVRLNELLLLKAANPDRR